MSLSIRFLKLFFYFSSPEYFDKATNPLFLF